MASSREYLDLILEQLSQLENIRVGHMMGEYIIYYRGRIAGGIYDDRLLVKPVNAMPNAPLVLPYEGSRKMLQVDDVENREFLCKLLKEMYDELPIPKKRK